MHLVNYVYNNYYKTIALILILITICSQYNKQHIIPLEEVKLESLADEGRKYIVILR